MRDALGNVDDLPPCNKTVKTNNIFLLLYSTWLQEDLFLFYLVYTASQASAEKSLGYWGILGLQVKNKEGLIEEFHLSLLKDYPSNSS